MSRPTRAPRLFRFLLHLRPLGDRHEEIAADLDELFVTRAARFGLREARRRYRRDVISVWLRWTPGRSAPPGRPRGMSRAGWLPDVFDDLRYGTRVFRRQPVLVSLALAGLAVAMGVATAAFIFVHAHFRPMSVVDPESVVTITRIVGRERHEIGRMTRIEFEAIREAVTTVRPEAAVRASARLTDQVSGLAEQPLRVVFVSDTYFATFGARPAIGRLLAESDGTEGAPPVAVLTHGRWRATFGRDSAVVGRTIYANGVPVTIVGVLDEASGAPFRAVESVDMLLPLASRSQIEDSERLEGEGRELSYSVSGRLVGDATVEQASAEVQTIGASLGLRLDDAQAPEGIIARLASETSTGDALAVLTVVGVLVGLVVLLAATNVANLLLAGNTARAREIAARLTLGATPRRILRQLLTESLHLAVVAAAAGVLAAGWLTEAVARMLGASPHLDLSLSPIVIALIGMVSLLVGLVAGLGPARYAVRRDIGAILKGAAPAVAASGLGRLRALFVGLQAAASILLLVLTALFARALVEASSPELPFDPAELVEVEAPSYGDAAKLPDRDFWPVALDRVLRLPGVQAATLVESGPFGGMDSTITSLPGIGEYRALKPPVDHRFFEVVQIRTVAGRTFSANEVAAGARVGVVSERFARDFWPGQHPLGQNPSHVRDDMPDVVVIGVVEDVPWDVSPPRYFGAPVVFLPLADDGRTVMLVRTADADATVRGVQEALGALDAGRRPRAVRVSDRLAGSLRQHATFTTIAGIVGALALTLAFIGLFGVTAFMVALRRREIGIRLAIGASPGGVVSLVFREGMRPVVIGLGVGLALATAGTQVFAEFLTGGVSPRDPVALGAAVAVLLVAASIGTFVPARRALGIQPTEVLKDY